MCLYVYACIRGYVCASVTKYASQLFVIFFFFASVRKLAFLDMTYFQNGCVYGAKKKKKTFYGLNSTLSVVTVKHLPFTLPLKTAFGGQNHISERWSHVRFEVALQMLNFSA